MPNDHPRVQVTVLKSVGAGEIPVPKGQVPHARRRVGGGLGQTTGEVSVLGAWG